MEQTILQQIIEELYNSELVDKENKRLTGLVEIKKAEELIIKLEAKLTEQLNLNGISF